MSPFSPDRQHLYLHLNGLFTEKKRQHIKRGPRYTKAEGTKVIRDYIKYYSGKNTVCAYAVGWSEFYCPSAQAVDLFFTFRGFRVQTFFLVSCNLTSFFCWFIVMFSLQGCLKNLSHPNMQHAALLNKAYRSGWIQGCRNCLCLLFFGSKRSYNAADAVTLSDTWFG